MELYRQHRQVTYQKLKCHHFITEWLKLEGTLKIILFQPPAMGRATHQLRLPRAPFNLALSASRMGHPQLPWAAVPGPHHPPSEEFPLTVPLASTFLRSKPLPLVPSPSDLAADEVYVNIHMPLLAAESVDFMLKEMLAALEYFFFCYGWENKPPLAKL